MNIYNIYYISNNYLIHTLYIISFKIIRIKVKTKLVNFTYKQGFSCK